MKFQRLALTALRTTTLCAALLKKPAFDLVLEKATELGVAAVRPVLTTGKPEALRISVGTGDAPAVGPAGTRVAGVSLLAADLMQGPTAPSAAAPVPDSLATNLGEPANAAAPE